MIYHGTPLSPRAALEAMAGRAFCVSFYRPDDVATVERIASSVMYDNGAFSFWMAARRKGLEACEAERDWKPYYKWLAHRIAPNRWAVIPDAIAMPSQVNDGLLNEWPHGQFGAPVWHMDEPISRLGRLCERWKRVCLGWVHPDQAENRVGSDSYRRRMDEVADLFGNTWPVLHMLRGVAVARDYPFRQRRQHQSGAERVEAGQPHRRHAWRSLARSQGIRGSSGRKAA